MPDLCAAREAFAATMAAIAADKDSAADLGLPADLSVSDGEPARMPQAAIWTDVCPTALTSSVDATCHRARVSWEIVAYAMVTRATREQAVSDCHAAVSLAACAALANPTLGRRVNSCSPRVDAMGCAPNDDRRWSCAAEVHVACTVADAAPPKSVTTLMKGKI